MCICGDNECNWFYFYLFSYPGARKLISDSRAMMREKYWFRETSEDHYSLTTQRPKCDFRCILKCEKLSQTCVNNQLDLEREPTRKKLQVVIRHIECRFFLTHLIFKIHLLLHKSFGDLWRGKKGSFWSSLERP